MRLQRESCLKRIFPGLVAAIFLLSCSGKRPLSTQEHQAYVNEVNSWHAGRTEDLKRPDGWLVGLYWLSPGIATFGSDEKNNIVFPKGKIAAQAGYFVVEGNTVSLHVNREALVTRDGRPVTQEIIFHFDSAKSAVLKSGTLQWTIIKRESKIGIRLRDLDSEVLKTFVGIERFPVDPGFRVDAEFKKADSTRTISITNALGQTTEQSSPGTLVFSLQGNNSVSMYCVGVKMNSS